MQTYQRFFWTFLLGLGGLWFWADSTVWADVSGVFAWRNALVQASGVLGMGAMSVAMLLALRPLWLESALGGLDKTARLHKWLGIGGLVLSVAHWLLANGPKWAVGWGWLARPVRAPRAALAPEAWLQTWLQSQRGWAEGVGEWAFYAAVLLIALALIKRFPYRYFVKTHHLLALVYLALVAHAAMLLKFEAWGSALGGVMALLVLAGSLSAVWVLLGRNGRTRQVAGRVTAVRPHPALQSVEVDVALHEPWPGHAAGQFAFVRFHQHEGAHPYTIASAWTGQPCLRFIIKALGDYTGQLASSLQVGDAVQVQGPYGRVNFEGSQRRQIWVAAGIGITPFVARMQARAHAPEDRAVDLFHTDAVLDPRVASLMQQDARAAQVRLHLRNSQEQGRLKAAHIATQVPDWRSADVWFCGPARFGQTLKASLIAMGLPQARFHEELFEMR